MDILDELAADIDGVSAIKDWLGDGGKPVSPAQSDSRAVSCVSGGKKGRPCPHNVLPKWWESAKGQVADWIRKELEVKNSMNISTPHDDGLHICDICKCCMALKVHTPIQHIQAHTPPGRARQFPSFCWQKKELSQYVKL
jgi:hypothetical protein